jgi:hypothetical protein
VSRLLRAAEEKGMLIRRFFVAAATVVVAVLAAACDSVQGSGSLTAPSSTGSQASATVGQSGLTGAPAAGVPGCGAFDPGPVTTPPGATPPSGPPAGATPAPGNQPEGTFYPPGSQPPGGLGTVSDISGSCPSVTFAINGKTVRTNASTSYAGGSCASLKNGARAAVMGAGQSDGSIAATCVSFGN